MTATILTFANNYQKTKDIMDALQADEDQGWTYEMVQIGNTNRYYIKVLDHDGNVVGELR